MLAGAELPGAVPGQAAAPGHGAGSHLAELTGPLTSPAQPPLPVARSPRAAQGTHSRLEYVIKLCQQPFGLCMEAVRVSRLQWDCYLHTGACVCI